MQTARIKLQGIYSLLAGFILLVGVPIYQSAVLGPAGYRGPSDTAFTHSDYGPLLGWIGLHSNAFIVFRLLEIIAFFLIIRLPIALHRSLKSYGHTLARWMLAGGLVGLALFVAMIALSSVSFINAAADYSQAPSSAAARDVASNFAGLYGVEALGQNTLGGALLAIFLLCANLLIARSGKLSNLLVYFGLLVAALMASLAVLFAISPPDAQTQLTTPALASFAIWLIWLGILLILRAGRLVAEPVPAAVSAIEPVDQTPAGARAADLEEASANSHVAENAETPASAPPGNLEQASAVDLAAAPGSEAAPVLSPPPAESASEADSAASLKTPQKLSASKPKRSKDRAEGK